MHRNIVIARFKQIARWKGAVQTIIVWNAMHCHIRIIQCAVHMVAPSAAVIM